MTIPLKISLALGFTVLLAGTFQAGWEVRGDHPAFESVVSSGTLGELGRRMIGVTWLTGVASVVALLATRRAVARPLRDMVEWTRRGDKRERRPPRDEMGELANEIETMRDSLERTSLERVAAADVLLMSSERVRHWDRYVTLSRVAGTMAHELGTPLNVIEGRATMLLADNPSPDEVRKNAQIIVQQSAKMTSILRDLVTFARRQPLGRSSVDLDALVRSAIGIAQPAATARNVVIAFEADNVAQYVQGDSDRILQATMNLVMNGIQAMPEGGSLTVGLRSDSMARHDDPDGEKIEHACLTVTDTGVGITEDVLGELFRPFFTTKSTDEGVGLGLSIAQGIAKDHHGFIDVTSEPGHGARFVLCLPKGNANAE